MNKNVNVYGCSQSAGVNDFQIIYPNGKKHPASWVFYLSQRYPQHTFYNYGIPGTSLVFSCHNFDLFQDRADVNIIQMTGPYRFTYHNITLDPYTIPLEQLSDNYYAFTDWDFWKDNFTTVTNAQPNKPDWLNKYYEYKPEQHDMIENLSLMSHYGQLADFAFSHAKIFKHRHEFLKPKVPCILDSISDFTYESYKVDKPGHFNEEGLKFMSLWVDSYVNLAFSE